MLITPSENAGSQLERALIAYFYTLWPTAILARPSFNFSNDYKTRALPLIDVMAHKSSENPANTMDEDWSVRIAAEWDGANQPGQANAGFNWVQINKLIGIPVALLRVTANTGQSYTPTAMAISAAGRRLAVFGTPAITDATADDIANNADMVNFVCPFVKYMGAVRAKENSEGTFLVEERNWLIRSYNNADDSIFPALTFDGAHTLNWTFTVGGLSATEPGYWILQKSPDGITWTSPLPLDGALRTADITGTGTNYWRVFRSDDGATLLDPESNTVLVTNV